jgi:hypothetical protein
VIDLFLLVLIGVLLLAILLFLIVLFLFSSVLIGRLLAVGLVRGHAVGVLRRKFL